MKCNRSSLMFLAILASAACGTDLPTGAGITEPTQARVVTHTSTSIGALLGDYLSSARAVNDAGDVAGWTCCGTGTGAFAVVAGTAQLLPGAEGRGLGISNGSPAYVVGSAASRPVRWSLENGSASQPEYLAEETGFGAALGVNSSGAAVGRDGAHAVTWSAAGTRIEVAAPAGLFARGEGRGINDDGHAVFVFFESFAESAVARSYVRLAGGTLIELPPESGDVTSYANDLSETVSGIVYVAGTTRTGPYEFRSVRWTVDVTTGQILATTVRPEMGHGLAVSDAGAVAGFLEANAMRTPRFTAFLARESELLKLSSSKGSNNGRAYAISPSGEFIAGEAMFRLSGRAVLWTIIAP